MKLIFGESVATVLRTTSGYGFFCIGKETGQDLDDGATAAAPPKPEIAAECPPRPRLDKLFIDEEAWRRGPTLVR